MCVSVDGNGRREPPSGIKRKKEREKEMRRRDEIAKGGEEQKTEIEILRN